MELNQEQKKAHDELVEYVTAKEQKYVAYLLQGYAGTGKTTTVSQVVTTLLQFAGRGLSICMSAPTHKAVKVLKKFSNMGDDVAFATIHSLLELEEHIDERTGKITFKEKAFRGEDEPRITEFDVMFLDEASMLNEYVFSKIMPYSNKLKIIFIGDEFQAPPIGEEIAKVFMPHIRAVNKIGHLTLDTIMRQALENPILEYATDMRKERRDVRAVPKMNGDQGIEVFIGKNQEADIKNRLIQMFCGVEFKADPDYAKVIAWRNATVNSINAEIRKLMYKKDVLPNIVVGEYLVMDKPLIEGKNKVLLHTSDELIVKEVSVADHIVVYHRLDERGNPVPDHCSLKYYDTLTEHEEIDGTIRKYRIKIVHDDSMVKYNQVLEANKSAALNCRDYKAKGQLWKSYYGVQKEFAQVKYNYAITAHKSQGSTYKLCMSFEWDLDANFNKLERNKLKYVAATRPQKKLIIIK